MHLGWKRIEIVLFLLGKVCSWGKYRKRLSKQCKTVLAWKYIGLVQGWLQYKNSCASFPKEEAKLHLVFMSTGIRVAVNLLRRSGMHSTVEGSNEPCWIKKPINIIGAVNLSPSLCLCVKYVIRRVLAKSLDVFWQGSALSTFWSCPLENAHNFFLLQPELSKKLGVFE